MIERRFAKPNFRSTLLPRLIRGEIRVKDVEKFIGKVL